MLVRTPAHQPTESLLGYILRLSETNGYDTPWHVLSHAGIAQGTMLTAGLPVDCLAKVLGRTAEDLSGIAYSANVDGHREFRLLGHPLGRGLNTTPLRLNRPAICPHCIAEHGYIDAFFDLHLAAACPHHRCELLSHCPTCSEPLSWFRPGLLTCKCGASLADAATPIVSGELADLLAIVWTVLHRRHEDSLSTHTAWPVRDLLGTSLRALALKLPDLGAFQRRTISLDAEATQIELLDGAAKTLSNWPEGFHAFLHGLSAIGDGKQHTFGKRHELFSKHFFNTRHCGNDFVWLRDEFVRYGVENWSEAVVDQKMLRDDREDRRYVSKRELARQMNVSQATLATWAKQGRINLKVIKANKQLRYVADTEDARNQVPKRQAGEVLDAREAAAYLGIPVSVLIHLKATGAFIVMHQAKQKKAFHQGDLDNFKLQLGAAPVADNSTTSDDAPLVSLSQALGEYRFHSTSNKAAFVVAYLSGQVIAAKLHSGDAHDIYFRKSDVDTFVSSSRRHSAGGSHSLGEAAKLIGCDPIVLPKLVADGHLAAEAGREGSRISSTSLEQFMARYASICGLARELNTSSNRLLRLCEPSAVPLMQVTRNSGKPTSFVRREDVEVLKHLSAEYPARKAKAPNENRTVLAVRLYLADLRTLGEPLPRRGGKPNRQAIAKACGIDRCAFYNNPNVVRLVDEYAEGD